MLEVELYIAQSKDQRRRAKQFTVDLPFGIHCLMLLSW